MLIKKKILVLGLILIFAIGVVACSSDQDSLEAIKEKGELSFAMTGQYPPFNFVDEDDGSIIGFDIDIATEIANRLGVEAKPITTDWDGIVAGLEGGSFDTIVGSMAVTEDRLERVNFTNPYYFDGAQLFVKGDSDIESIEDFENGDIGVVVGTTFEAALMELDNVNIKNYQSDVDNMRDLEMGRLDGLVTARFVGMYSAMENDLDIVPAGEPLYREEIAIPVRKNDEALLEAMNNALADMIEDGTYAQLSEKWFGIDMTDDIK
jgi:polar amino acid transport system substrate-binding protein